jgi:hypothetical protein
VAIQDLNSLVIASREELVVVLVIVNGPDGPPMAMEIGSKQIWSNGSNNLRDGSQ